MPLNPIQFLFDLLDRQISVVQVPLLVVLVLLGVGSELLVILEGFDTVVWVGVEQISENLGVGSGIFGPHIPDFIGQRVGDEFVGIIFVVFVGTVGVGWIGVSFVARGEVLRWEETKMFATCVAQEDSNDDAV